MKFHLSLTIYLFLSISNITSGIKNVQKKFSEEFHSLQNFLRDVPEKVKTKSKKKTYRFTKVDLILISLLLGFVLYYFSHEKISAGIVPTYSEASHPKIATLSPIKNYKINLIQEAINATVQAVDAKVQIQQKKKGIPYGQWVTKKGSTLYPLIENTLAEKKINIDSECTLYTLQQALLELRYTYSVATLASYQTQLFLIYLKHKNIDDLAEEISGDTEKNMLGQALLLHENSKGVTNKPATKGNLNLIPYIHVLLFYTKTIDPEYPNNDPKLLPKIYGHDKLSKLAEAKKLSIDNGSFHYDRKKQPTNKVRVVPKD